MSGVPPSTSVCNRGSQDCGNNGQPIGGGHFKVAMDNGYVLWTFQGKQLAQASFEAFYQFAWRPRELLHRRKKLRKLQRISKSMRSSAMHLTRLRNVSSDCKRRKASAKVGLSSEMSWLDLPSGEHGRRWNGWSYWGDMTVTMRRTIRPRRLLLRRSLTQRRTLFTRLMSVTLIST